MDWNSFVRASWKVFIILLIPLLIVGILLVVHGSKSSKRSKPFYSQQIASADDDESDSKFKLWPNQIIPYVIDPTLSDAGILIKNSFKLIHTETCIKFIEKTTTDTNWVRFVRNDDVCFSSHIGRHFATSKSGQEVQFGIDCLNIANIQRALGALLGLAYEETRIDRDKYIRYNPWRHDCINRTGVSVIDIDEDEDDEHGNRKNVTNSLVDISNEHSPAALNIIFDYASHMLIAKECFTPLRGSSIKLGSSDGNDDGGILSVLDLEKINAIYNCSGCKSYRFLAIHTIESSPLPFGSFNPIQTGTDIDSHPLYICRAYHQGSLLIGKMKLTNEHSYCWVAYERKEFIYSRNFEVLTNPEGYNYTWLSNDVEATNYVVPANAVIGGRTNDRETIYIGKCTIAPNYSRTTVGGSYSRKLGYLTVPFGSIAHRCTKFDLFVC